MSGISAAHMRHWGHVQVQEPLQFCCQSVSKAIRVGITC